MYWLIKFGKKLNVTHINIQLKYTFFFSLKAQYIGR